MRIRPSALHLLLLTVCTVCSSCGAGDKLRPNDPTYAGALGGGEDAICHKPGAAGTPLIVDWRPEARGDLEIALKRGVAVVHYDCDGVTLLPQCKVEGEYTYVGMSRKEELISMSSADDVKANLPVGSAQLGGAVGRGTTLDIGLMMVGMKSTTIDSLKRSALSGSCDGATHFVRSTTLGGFAMKTAAEGSVKVAAQVFSVGASASSTSGKTVNESDGDLDSCKTSDPDGKSAPSGCQALLRVELDAIDAPSSKGNNTDVICGEGLAPIDGKCTSGVKRCEGPDECEKRCFAGEQIACWSAGVLLVEDENQNHGEEHARGFKAYKHGCEIGEKYCCGQYGALAVGLGQGGSYQEDDPTKALAALEGACAGGVGEACSVLGTGTQEGHIGDGKDVFTKDDAKATRYYSRACLLGDEGGCFDYGTRIAATDPAGAVTAWRMSCESDDYSACESLGGAYESGKGVTADADAATALYTKACKLAGENHDCRKVGVAPKP